MQSTRYSKNDISYDRIVGNNTVVSPSYDPHCLNDISGGCEPIEIISAERLVEVSTGPVEGRKIARALQNRQGVDDFLIEEDAWACIWNELIVNKKGVKTFLDREGLEERDYNFSVEMLEGMITELSRLITKYSGSEWSSRSTANYLVELLEEHRDLLEIELAEVQSGARKLTKMDVLGKQTRKEMFGDE